MTDNYFNSKVNFFYCILFIVVLIFSTDCIIGSVAQPYIKDELQSYELLNVEPVKQNYQRVEYQIKGSIIQKAGGTLAIYEDHWEYKVNADEEEIFCKQNLNSIFCRTTGSSWTLIEIPKEARKVNIVFTSNVTEQFNHNIHFVVGDKLDIYKVILYNSLWQIVLGIILIGIGIFMVTQWFVVFRKSGQGLYIIYFGIIDLLIGIWSMMVSDVVLLDCSNAAAVYFVGHMCLLCISFPLIMFTKEFYRISETMLFKVLCAFTLAVPMINIMIQLTGIRELRQQLPFTHMTIFLTIAYMIYAIVSCAMQHKLSYNMMISVIGLFIFFAGNIFTLVLYYVVNDTTFNIPITFLLIYCLFTWYAISLENKKLLEEGRDIEIYKRLAEKDVLTGLANRNSYECACTNTALESGICLITFDLNDLKIANDNSGHEVGDKMIKKAAEFISVVFGNVGMCFRIGGDEFCVIAKNTSDTVIKHKIDKLKFIEERYNKNETKAKVYLASGYAFYDQISDTTIEDIRRRADEFMYADKRRSKKVQSEISNVML